MSEFLASLSNLGSLLQTVVFGQDFNKSFPYAMAFVLAAILIGVVLRRTDPRRLRAKFKNYSATTLLYFINLFAFAPFVLLASDTIRSAYGALGLPQLDPAIWTGASPWILVPVALLAYDFADYWSHRIMHKSWLWPVHAIHHSETEMTGLTTYRVHFLEPVIMGTAYIVLLTRLGLPGNILGYGAILVSLHNAYVHMDLEWGHGPFRLLLASPRYHRWHHANAPEAYGKNLANIFRSGTCCSAPTIYPASARNRSASMAWPNTTWSSWCSIRSDNGAAFFIVASCAPRAKAIALLMCRRLCRTRARGRSSLTFRYRLAAWL